MRDRGDGIYPVLQPFAVRSVYFPSLFSKYSAERTLVHVLIIIIKQMVSPEGGFLTLC